MIGAMAEKEPLTGENETTRIAGQLKWAIILNMVIVVIQVVGGAISNSLGLLSDAAHNFTDTAALGLSYFALLQTLKPATLKRTYGHHRSSILAAFVNSFFLIILTGGILFQAYLRILHPETINGKVMYSVAFFAFIGNGLIALLFTKSRRNELNARMAFLHMAGDALASLGVIFAGVVIDLTHWLYIDPIVSIAIGLVIASGAVNILKETLNILMEGAPGEIPVERVVETLSAIPEVKKILDLHLWTVGSRYHVLSCRILVDNVTMKEGKKIRETIRRRVAERHSIDHLTIELEVEAEPSITTGCELFQKKAV